MRLTGRSDEQIALVEAYAREQGLFHDASTPSAEYSELLSLDLSTVESSLAGPSALKIASCSRKRARRSKKHCHL